MNIELIITIISFLGAGVIGLIVNSFRIASKYTEIVNKIANNESNIKEVKTVGDVHSVSIQELTNEVTGLKENIKLEIKHLTVMIVDLKKEVEASRRENQETHIELIKALKSFNME